MRIIILLFSILISQTFFAQDSLRVMTYNVLNYGNITSYCTTNNNLMADKQPHFKNIISYYQPDILGVNELGSNSYLHQLILDSVMNAAGSKNYDKAIYSNQAGGYLTNTLYFNSDKLALKKQGVLSDIVRDIIIYQLYYKSPDLASVGDTAFLNVIIAHLKAGSESSDLQTRMQEVNNMMSELENNYPVGDYIFMGDFNLKSSSEQSYQNLINYSNANYRFYDPINTPGSWNNSSTYQNIHTQSTHSSSNGCASGGGLDDRFDIILTSSSILNGTNHYTYIPNSYFTPGNDGNHFNSSINSGTNNSAPSNIINSLYSLSDHLPVILELEVDQIGAGLNENIISEIMLQNPVKDNLDIIIKSKEITDFAISIYSLDSKLIYSDNLEIINNINNIKINTESWVKGVYIINFSNDNHYISKKL